MNGSKRLCVPLLCRISSQKTFPTWLCKSNYNLEVIKQNEFSSFENAKWNSPNPLFDGGNNLEVYRSAYSCNQIIRIIEPETNERNQRLKSPYAGILVAFSLFGFFTRKREDEDEKTRENKRKTVLKPGTASESHPANHVAEKKKKVAMLPKNPPVSSEIPSHVPYLIIGGGTASCAAFQTILKKEPSAKVLVISSEPYYPYTRPPLSKEMWFQDRPSLSKPHVFKLMDGKEKSLFYRTGESYTPCRDLMSEDAGGVAVARGWHVKKIDVDGKKVFLDDDYCVEYEKCLIATGCSPKTVPPLTSGSTYVKERVSYFCDFSDYQKVDNILKSGDKKIAVIGGGVLGSELACSLAYRGRKNGVRITQIYSESGNLKNTVPEYLSNWTTAKLRSEGIRMYPNCTIQSVSEKDGLMLHLSNGEEVFADHVILAIGGIPNTHFAETSSLEIDHESGGLVVNAELMARSNIWVAGDCCSFFDSKTGRTRLERYDHAVATGRLAAENMTGASKPYEHQSILWSNLGPKFGYEAVGLIDASLPTISVFSKEVKKSKKLFDADNKSGDANAVDEKKEEFSKGIVFYLKNGVIVGILLWNVYGQLSAARQIITEKRREDEFDDVVKRFSFVQEVPFPHMDGKMYVM